jgi:hypothetical protein
MICYTLSDCVLKNLSADTQKKKIITTLLGVFSQENKPHKVVIDRTGKIIDIYNTYIDSEAGVFYWLQIMSDNPSSWEPVDVDNIEQATTNEDVFLLICSQTADKLLIVYSHNGWTKNMYSCKGNITHNNTTIKVLDREEAINQLALSEEEINRINRSGTTYNIINSAFAQNGSGISNVKIKK